MAADDGVLAPGLRLRTVGLLFSVGLVAVDSLGVTTALPRVAADLRGTATYGWAISALTLAIVIGTAGSGPVADRRGPRGPALAGLGVFVVGLVVAVLASSWWVFLLGRIVQGVGVGAVTTMATVTAVRDYPERLRARAFAVVSAAWMLPSLVGPAVSGVVADVLGWRAVFVLLLVLVVPAVAITARAGPGGAAPGAAAESDVGSTLTTGVVLAGGAGAVLVGLEQRGVMLAVLIATGAVVTLVALRRVVPVGTVFARRGTPAGVAARGLLCVAYFTADTFLPLGIVALDHGTTVVAGVVISAGSLGWSAGSALQARGEGRHGRGRRGRHLVGGVGFLGLGIALVAAGLLVAPLPAVVAATGWAVAGVGMGYAYNAATTETLDLTHDGSHGRVSAALQLVQTLGIALGAGVGTSVLDTLGTEHLAGGLAVVLGLAGSGAVVCLPVAARIPPYRVSAAVSDDDVG